MLTVILILVGISISFLCLLFLVGNHLHSFLALHCPIENAEILVVEGWIGDDNLKDALMVFEEGTYHTIVTVGGPLKFGRYLMEYKTWAELAAATLIALGCDSHRIIVAPSGFVLKDRTASTAMMFKELITDYQPTVHAINIYSYGVHARRSRLLYQALLAPDVRVGVVSGHPTTYDPTHWWRSSEAIKGVLLESTSLVYTILTMRFSTPEELR